MLERNHESDSLLIPYRLYYYNIPIIIFDSMLINVQVLNNIGKLYFTSIMKNRITNRINIMQISILIVPSIVIRCLYYYLLLFNVFNAESYMFYCHNDLFIYMYLLYINYINNINCNAYYT
jgi:hypothetical protein